MEIKNQSQLLIRIGGILYLVLICCGVYAEIFVLSPLIVANDPTTTATNILSHETLFRWGIVAHIITLVCSSFLLGILFKMFKPASEFLAVCMVIFNVAAVTVEAVSILYQLETISILKSKPLGIVFSIKHINAMAYLPLRMQNVSYDLALLFFGIVCCLISILILKSKLFFRWVAVLMLLAGICYITNSVSAFLSPSFRNSLLPFILVPCLIAELSLSINMMLGTVRSGSVGLKKRRNSN